jgi:cytoskeleton protein RodZ
VPRRPRFPPRFNQVDEPPESEARPPAGGVAGARRGTPRPPPWDKGPDAESGSFGAWLRRQREAREINLRDIAERTKISLRYLEAMEQDRFDVLPAPVFAKGFLREYARYVGLSPDEVVNHYLSVHPPFPGEERKEQARQGRRSPANWTSVVVLGLIALLLALLALHPLIQRLRHGGRLPASSSTPPAAAAAPAPAARPAGAAAVPAGVSAATGGAGDAAPSAPRAEAADVPPAVPPAAAPAPAQNQAETARAPLLVTLDFTHECWVDVLVDGTKRSSQEWAQGESLQLEAKESVVFKTLGNAGGVEIQVNGYPYPLNKKPGEVVRDLAIDLDTVRALKEKKEAR